jgi:hypothetical protein
MEGTQMIETKKDHYIMIADGINYGEHEVSWYRNHIEKIDNVITIELK